MADHYLIKGETLSDIADAIREKTGNDSPIAAEDMAGEIENIPQSGAEGTIYISQNNTYNVSQYQYADVQVPQPSGKITITENGTNINIKNFEYADVNTNPEKGIIFNNYDEDGFPHSAKLIGNWVEIPYGYAWFGTKNSQSHIFIEKIENLELLESITKLNPFSFGGWSGLKKIVIPENVTVFGGGGATPFNNCPSLEEIVFEGNVPSLGNIYWTGMTGIKRVILKKDGPPAFVGLGVGTQVELWDCSNASFVFPINSRYSLRCASGCIIKIPYNLSDEYLGAGNGWQSATNWCDLPTDPNEDGYVVWELV